MRFTPNMVQIATASSKLYDFFGVIQRVFGFCSTNLDLMGTCLLSNDLVFEGTVPVYLIYDP
jgi:hypothetical protein